MQRRHFLSGSAASLALPAIARAQGSRVLKFIPQSDVTILDPIWTTAYVTRNHGFMIFDTLYGIDNQYRSRPQMVEGHTVENNGKLWRLKLRDNLTWHDGERVLARDCVASLQRWGKRDGFGQRLMSQTGEMKVIDDDYFAVVLFNQSSDRRLDIGQTDLPIVEKERKRIDFGSSDM